MFGPTNLRDSVVRILIGLLQAVRFTIYLISLIPRLLPSFLSHTVQKTGREPRQFDHVRDDVLCVVLCMVLVIELSPTHAVLERITMLETESPC